MFCRNCGTEIKESSIFCSKCGHRVAEEAVEEVAPSPAEAMPSMTQMPTLMTGNVMPNNATGNNKIWSKLLGKKSYSIVAVVVVVLLVWFNFGAISNAMMKAVLSPEKYYQYVEKKVIDDAATMVADVYESAFVNRLKLYDTSTENELWIELGDEAQELIMPYLGLGDVEWLSKVGVQMGMSVKDNVLGANGSVLLGEDSLISGSVVLDLNESAGYIQIPELTKQYLGADLEVLGFSGNDIAQIESAIAQYEDIYEALPKKATIKKLVKRYLTIVAKCIDDVDEKTDRLELDNIGQKCTVLRVRLTQEDYIEMIEAVCETALDDKELHDIIATMASVTMGEEMGMDAEETFIAGIEEVLRSVETARRNGYMSDQEIVMNVWVNGKGEVVGRDVAVDDDYSPVEIAYYMPQKGSKYEMEFAVKSGYDSFKITGSGKKKSSSLSGEFEFSLGGRDVNMDILDISVTDFDTKQAKKGYLNGKFSLKPSMQFLSQYGLQSLSVFITDYSLDLEFDTSEKSSKVVVAVADDGERLATLTASTKIGSGKKNSVAKKQVTMVEDEGDIVEWAKTIDFEKFLEHIAKTALPEEVIEEIEKAYDYLDLMIESY